VRDWRANSVAVVPVVCHSRNSALIRNDQEAARLATC
jgi:hypothetical protein